MVWVYIVGIVAIVLGAGAFFGAPYVPTRRRDLQKLFDDVSPLKPTDLLLDMGSGDGVILREASRRGSRAVGFEINPIFYILAKFLSRGYNHVKVVLGNSWALPFPEDTTIVYIFSVSRDGKKVIRKLQQESTKLGRNLRLICYGSPLPGREPTVADGAYLLYDFHPLHPDEP